MTPWPPVDLRTGVMHDTPTPTTTIPLIPTILANFLAARYSQYMVEMWAISRRVIP
jgi:hypothetical protein